MVSDNKSSWPDSQDRVAIHGEEGGNASHGCLLGSNHNLETGNALRNFSRVWILLKSAVVSKYDESPSLQGVCTILCRDQTGLGAGNLN